jgi:hypothetical protein
MNTMVHAQDNLLELVGVRLGWEATESFSHEQLVFLAPS